MKRRSEEILAEFVATDIQKELTSPSELRAHFGGPEDLRAYVDHHEMYHRKLQTLLDELSECEK